MRLGTTETRCQVPFLIGFFIYCKTALLLIWTILVGRISFEENLIIEAMTSRTKLVLWWVKLSIWLCCQEVSVLRWLFSLTDPQLRCLNRILGWREEWQKAEGPCTGSPRPSRKETARFDLHPKRPRYSVVYPQLEKRGKWNQLTYLSSLYNFPVEFWKSM